MVVRIRLGQARLLAGRRGENSRMAVTAASFMSLAAVSSGALGLWRLGMDLNWAGDFAFKAGFLSHWQVWIGTAAAIQYGAWRLNQWARTIRIPEPSKAAPDESEIRAAASI
jgi:hypothetical protein